MANQIGKPRCTLISAMIMPEKPIMEPTERSNSPAIIKRQAPTAMMANCAETVPQLTMPSAENMPLSLAMPMKNMKTRIVPQMAPSSGRISALRMEDISRMRSSLLAAGPVVGGVSDAAVCCVVSAISLLLRTSKAGRLRHAARPQKTVWV
ncbi:hypothetical protein LP7551_02974 [Roseibium album]|nr:hypothetical protein LP7551_02974 [Roseibium album]